MSEDVFTSLYAKYNTFTGAILDPDSFFLDVTEACEKANSKHEFISCLEERSKKRKDEATEAFERFAIKAVLDPRLSDELAKTLVSFTRSRSFDTLVIFLEHVVSRVTAVEKDPENALELHGRLLPPGSATTALPRKSEPEPEDGDEAPASPKRRKMGRQRKLPRRSPKKMLASAPRRQPEKSEQPVSLRRSARLRASPRPHAPAPKTHPNKTTGRTRRKKENA